MKKEEKKFVESLNKDKIEGHEALSLVFSRGYWDFTILCSCGKIHPTGGVDQKFVLWDIVSKKDYVKKEEIPHILIEDLNLKTRTYNCLKGRRINNFKLLVDFLDNPFKIPYLGKVTVNELEKLITTQGLAWNNKIRSIK